MHWACLVDWKQVKVDELGLGQHELDITIVVICIGSWNCAVKQIITLARLKNFQVNQSLVAVKLIFEVSFACVLDFQFEFRVFDVAFVLKLAIIEANFDVFKARELDLKDVVNLFVIWV